MVRVYECVNGHQLVPLMPSGFVKTLGKGFGNSLFVHYVVLALGCHVASMQLEKGSDFHQFAGKLTTRLYVNTLFCCFIHGMAMLIMPSLICLQVETKAL